MSSKDSADFGFPVDADVDVDVEEPDTSQLPSVEEVKDSAAFSSGAGSGKRCSRCCCISTVLMIAIGIVLIIGVAVGVSKNKQQSSGGQTPVRDPNSAEFLARAADVANFVISEGLSDASAVEAAGSPQNRAVGFMAVGDDAQMLIPASATEEQAFEFVQRYALSVLFYALGGESWDFGLDFLIGDPTCLWYQTLRNTGGQTFNFGAQCDDNAHVDRILIRE